MKNNACTSSKSKNKEKRRKGLGKKEALGVD
jgi:hypothetical protein